MVKYTVKIGAVLLILMGVMTLTGFMNGITSYLSKVQLGGETQQVQETQSADNGTEASGENGAAAGTDGNAENASAAETAAEETSKEEKIGAPDFTLVDQYGETHTLSDYKGKTVFLNFWATWCPPCKGEMPDIQKLYEKY